MYIEVHLSLSLYIYIYTYIHAFGRPCRRTCSARMGTGQVSLNFYLRVVISMYTNVVMSISLNFYLHVFVSMSISLNFYLHVVILISWCIIVN